MAESLPLDQRLELIQTLCALPEVQFEQLCFSLKPPAGLVPSNAAAQGRRASALLEWVESPTGCGLSRFLEVLQFVAARISATLKPPDNTPLKGTHHFVGRDRDLARLHEQLQQSQPVAITAVVGMGGIGKTELALQYVRSHLEHYPGGVCWLEARDQDITAQILAFAATHLNFTPSDELPLEARITACWQQWPGQTQALVVIDDVTDYDQIEPYLPTAERFTRLLTTRHQQLATTVTSLNIEVLAEADALELLRELAGATRIEAELVQAKHLCNWLGYLPLALELVGRYLARKPDLSLAELQTRLESKELAARALVKAEPGMTNAEGVASAFELSWQELSDEAQELACFLSCFALAPIPWDRVPPCFPDADPEDLEDWRDQELLQANLLKRVESSRYQYHQLVQRFIRTKLSDDSLLIAAYCEAMILASKEMASSSTQAECLAWSEMVPHVAEATEAWLIQINDYYLIGPFVGLAHFYEFQGLYGQAEPWYERCLSITRNRLETAHPYVVTSLSNLAALYYSQDRYKQAEPLYIEALEMSRQLFGKVHQYVALSLNNLALLYKSENRYERAEPLYIEALEMRKKLWGREHPEVAQSLNNLAALRRSQGCYEQAESLYIEALDMYKQLLGDEHTNIAQSLNNLALLYHSQNYYEQAEPLYIKALGMCRRLLGNDHPSVALSLNNLAGLYDSQSHYEQAEPLYIEALDMCERLLGDEHTHTQSTLANLVNCLKQAISAGQTDMLSKHPRTQALLQKLRGESNSRKKKRRPYPKGFG